MFNLQKTGNASISLELVLIFGLLFLPTWIDADSLPPHESNSEIQNQETIIISQNESDRSGDSEKKEGASQNKDRDTENQKSEEKADKPFVPSIKIGAEQAIPFPYDI